MDDVDIAEIDSNFKPVQVGENSYCFHDIRTSPVEITGVFWDGAEHCFARVPADVIAATGNELLKYLRLCTAGGQVRFTTDSQSIALKFELYNHVDMLHMPRSGSSGFDLFSGGEFLGNAWQSDPAKLDDVCLMAPKLPSGMREYTLNMPLYNGVRQVHLGLLPGSRLGGPSTGSRRKVCFYGSSITQGGCASKPGNAYTSMICRWQNLEQGNLGFSGNAKGEAAMAEYIAQLRPDVFVMDYDHNAPTLEHLARTHEPFFKIIRNRLPALPVIFLTRPNTTGEGEAGTYAQRRDVIKATYDRAMAADDQGVWFVDCSHIMDGQDASACTMDGVHPNDLGFFRMACGIGKVLNQVIETEART